MASKEHLAKMLAEVKFQEKQLVASANWEIFHFPLDQVTPENLTFGIGKNDCFEVGFEASDFFDDRRGEVTLRYFTPKSRYMVDRLGRALRSRTSTGP